MPAKPMIDVQGLSKRFGKLQAVSDLSISVQAGELFGLVGPDGAGKTTTLRMLAGVMQVPYLFNPTINVMSFLFSAAIGVLFGYFPARRAARLDPIEALRHE